MAEDKYGTPPVNYPVRIIEGLHGGDYTFEQVAADLIDNSIDANATFVDVIIDKQDMGDERKKYTAGMQGSDKMYCIVLDDGDGIPSEDRLVEVMSRGVTRPEDNPYEEFELGSFGVGLKESSLSQAYEVTIFSKVEGGVINLIRLSSHAIKRHETDILLKRSELEPWMEKTQGFRNCLEYLGEQAKGTAVLLEGMHKMELEIGAGNREVWETNIETRVKNYLGLVFHKYIEGATIPISDGRKMEKQINLLYGGPRNRIKSLDPFCQDPKWKNGLSNGTIGRSTKLDVQVGDEVKKLDVTAWFLPHSKYPGRTYHQERMKSTKRLDSIMSMQGVYVYRNQRLVEFCSSDDPWKGILKSSDHQVYHRWEIHLPPGKNVGRDGASFKLNTSKSQVKFSVDVRSKLKSWGSKPGIKWHDDDPRIVSARERGSLRNGDDINWKKCANCKSLTHLTSQCKMPKKVKPKLKVNYETDRTKEQLKEQPNEQLKEQRNEQLKEQRNEQPKDQHQPKSVEVIETESGNLLSQTMVEGKMIFSINKNHPLYRELMRKLRGD